MSRVISIKMRWSANLNGLRKYYTPWIKSICLVDTQIKLNVYNKFIWYQTRYVCVLCMFQRINSTKNLECYGEDINWTYFSLFFSTQQICNLTIPRRNYLEINEKEAALNMSHQNACTENSFLIKLHFLGLPLY